MRRTAAFSGVLALLGGNAWAQANLSVNLGPVVPPDKGWVSQVWAGPWCDFFQMQPSKRTWAVPRGTPMHDGVLNAANQNKADWQYYKLAGTLGVSPAAPVVVVSASTSPSLPGSAHPPYSAVPTGIPSQAVCGSALSPYFHPMDAAIAILPASGY